MRLKFAAIMRESIVKNNVNCNAFKVSMIQAYVNFLINYTKSKYTFAILVKIVIRRTQQINAMNRDFCMYLV